MGFLAPCNSPNLFNRIQIRRVGRQRNNSELIANVCIVIFVLNQALRLFVPRSIIHYQDEFFSALELGSSHEFTDACDRGFIVEPSRFCNKELARSVSDESAVSNRFPTGIGLDLWTASFGVPLPGNRSLHCEVNLVLENNLGFLSGEELLQFFLNSPRLGSSSRSFDGNA